MNIVLRGMSVELNVNSPAYFTDHYGVDDEVYNFCRRLRENVKEKEYSEVLHTIGIMPIAAPEEYYHADSYEKIQIMRETILAAVKKVKTRGKFDYDRFKQDVESCE